MFNYFTSAISNEDAMKMWENEIRLESHKRGLEEGEARGIARGIAEGEARGEAKIKASIVNNLSKQGYDKAAISRLIGISMNELESILE